MATPRPNGLPLWWSEWGVSTVHEAAPHSPAALQSLEKPSLQPLSATIWSTNNFGICGRNNTVNRQHLYRVPEIVTLGRFPGGGESDSRWRTKEVRHVGS